MTMIAPGKPSEAEKEFQEKMKERLRTAMGDLMPDAVLAGIVARGIEEAFFKKRTRANGSYYGGTEEYEPWLVECIRTEAAVEVKKQVTAWVAANHEKLIEVVEKTLQGGITAAVSRSMDAVFSGIFENFSQEIQRKLDEIRAGNMGNR